MQNYRLNVIEDSHRQKESKETSPFCFTLFFWVVSHSKFIGKRPSLNFQLCIFQLKVLALIASMCWWFENLLIIWIRIQLKVAKIEFVTKINGFSEFISYHIPTGKRNQSTTVRICVSWFVIVSKA